MSIANEEVEYRSLEDLKRDGKSCSEHPLRLDIQLDHVIPDGLHMMLRITDVLLEALITTATAYDRKKHHEAQQEARTHHTCIPAYDILEGDMLKKL